MGAVVYEKMKKCVEWVGNIFSKVIKWFKEYMEVVNKKTEKFLSKKKEAILKCEKPKAIGQYLAAQHESKQIQKIADSYSKDLPPADLAAANKILSSETFDDD
jgi:hypothetical protein